MVSPTKAPVQTGNHVVSYSCGIQAFKVSGGPMVADGMIGIKSDYSHYTSVCNPSFQALPHVVVSVGFPSLCCRIRKFCSSRLFPHLAAFVTSRACRSCAVRRQLKICVSFALLVADVVTFACHLLAV